MMALTTERMLFIWWLAFSLFLSLPAVAVLVWAVCGGQWKDQDRARYLPLMDPEVQDKPDAGGQDDV